MEPHREAPLLVFLARTWPLVAGAGDAPDAAPGAGARPRLERLAGDGSARRIYRVRGGDLSLVLVVNPLPADRRHPDENEGFLAVREYLDQRGVRVPRFYAADLAQGFLLLEDLGDRRLAERIRAAGWGDDAAHRPLYERLLADLARMQAPGQPGFRSAWVPNPPYTEGFLLAEESRYFHRELVGACAAAAIPFDRIGDDTARLAGAALAAIDAAALPRGAQAWAAWSPAAANLAGLVFMHRDFQSRNVMVTGEGPAIIDFQGARLGPPEYDLAALLYDPYVAMPERTRAALLAVYLREAYARGVPGVPDAPTAAWERRFLANAANRLMQAAAAFVKLGHRMGRPGFREHLPTALATLEAILERLGDCTALAAWVKSLRASGGGGDPSRSAGGL
jgi:aminoglycoside/choline kinase family phosphotransferase